ncbi:SDR family NAD(P)-dependent oxidoreductase [Mucilaginibacter sp. KACC 22063]|uniref:SDR family NAD(P)-dependent oxidoreductase n=1 Tax=Mucilaginibacter sp. KACC 22063 TaxID=3025666 RepID=UPI002366C0DE|nr:SDR family NAD(P)-dependent oxidoreductase [Mucilaginibacter sp. KACC 22063]WDF55859.1 SDR family NAD(P)-dependent oxidoreductase [Mucilaginibacter sp. KACC 22063]
MSVLIKSFADFCFAEHRSINLSRFKLIQAIMKKVLITGASGGIGLETARQLAQQNYQVTLVARNRDRLEKALNSLSGNGHTILVADLNDKEDLQKLAAHLSAEKYDVLINNAGTGTYGKFTEIALEDQLATMQLNMQALVTLSYSFLQNATSGDALVNIGSLLAHSSLPGGSVYAATKSFVANFSESLWYEFKHKGVYVTGFNPGAANSDFHAHAGAKTSDFPKFVVSSVEDVARELTGALQKRQKGRVIQGWKNRFMLFGFKLLNRNAAVSIMGGISPGMAD